jgi:glutaredoxin
MQETFTVYSKDNCSFCQQAKSFLLMRSKKFEVKNLGSDYTLEEFRTKFPEQKTFPMIVHQKYSEDGDQFNIEVGGFDRLKEYLK